MMIEMSFSGSTLSLDRKNILIFSGEELFWKFDESLISKVIHIGCDLTMTKRIALLDLKSLTF
jgi:hypothetical protein